MTSRLLHALPIPSDAQTNVGKRIRGQIAAKGALDAGTGQVTPISLDPDQELLTGQYRGRYAEMMAAAVEELFSSNTIEYVPYFGRDTSTPADGYYALENVQTGRIDPRTDALHKYDGALRQQGTRRSHYRSVKVKPQDVTNPFGSGSAETVWLSAEATNVRWYDQAGQQTESATVQSTGTGEHSGFEQYDVTEPSFASNDTYHLVYALAYDEEYKSDPRVWDTYGRAKVAYTSGGGGSTTVGSATVGSGTVSSSTKIASTWQRVYSTAHEFVGRPFVETGRLRLDCDEDEGLLRAYSWDDAAQAWSRTALGSTAWRLSDVDLRRIGLERVVVRLQFEDQDNPGTTAPLDAHVKRGASQVQFVEPANASSTPAGLVTRLDPIASDSDRAVGGVATVVKKSEVDG